MAKAWPRLLPEPETDAIAHALIIEAYAIVVEQLSDGHESLIEAHYRALGYAEARYSPDEIRAARDACGAASENHAVRLPYLVGYGPFAPEFLRTAA
jgi:hypothetical protein